MNQCRKMKRILILITQEWRELPMWLRRPAKFMIQTKPTRILNLFGIFTSCVGDAENMVFDKDEGEYNCPPLKYVIYKRNKVIADMYDTFEPINQLQSMKKIYNMIFPIFYTYAIFVIDYIS